MPVEGPDYDWTARYPAIVAAALRLPAKHFVMDGKGIVEGEGGIGDFKKIDEFRQAVYFAAEDHYRD